MAIHGKSKILTEDGVNIVLGMKVWAYPANQRRGGSIKEHLVTYIHAPWTLYLDGILEQSSVWDEPSGCSHYLDGHIKLYSTLEAAQKVKDRDKGSLPWVVNGKFSVSCAATIVNYLVAMTGIDKSQIQAHRPCSVLHISWSDSRGMHKEKLRINQFYTVTKEDLAPIVAKMKGEHGG